MQGFSFAASRLSTNLIEDGAFCHFPDPSTGEPLYLPHERDKDGKPDPTKAVGAYVRSTSCKAYEDHLDAVTRKAISGNKRAKTDAQKQELVFKQLKEETPQSFAVLVARFQNTSLEGGLWEPSFEEKIALAKDPHQKFYVDIMVKFAEEPSHYGVESEGNAPGA